MARPIRRSKGHPANTELVRPVAQTISKTTANQVRTEIGPLKFSGAEVVKRANRTMSTIKRMVPITATSVAAQSFPQKVVAIEAAAETPATARAYLTAGTALIASLITLRGSTAEPVSL